MRQGDKLLGKYISGFLEEHRSALGALPDFVQLNVGRDSNLALVLASLIGLVRPPLTPEASWTICDVDTDLGTPNTNFLEFCSQPTLPVQALSRVVTALCTGFS